MVVLVVLGVVGWHYGVELPAARELAAQRAANARTIADLRLELVWIAPGEFLMGSPAQNLLVRWYYRVREQLTKQGNPGVSDDERPMTRVKLTQAFWLGRTEVTQMQWTAVMGSNPSYMSNKGDDLPVEMVSWDDAMEFCQKLTERERAAGRLGL